MNFLSQAITMQWEAISQNLPYVIVLALLFIIAWVVWAMRSVPLSRGGLATMLALVVAAIAFFVLPTIFHSSISDMTYWVDWAFHLATIFGVFVYSYLVLLPLLSGLMPKKA
ncbi:hypothetical protein VH441_06625 [Psychrobacter sp. HD31]|uniref:hypothetical protein n=1 Tax=Psychrobacter sp. HD31 TaxID=3112003 RepID=UPI003DA4B100